MPQTLLVSNDRSGPRRARLRRVLEEFLPRVLLREPAELTGRGGDDAIAVTGIDAAQWGRGAFAPAWSTTGFDRILVDAPCSSERHFLQGAAEAAWSRSRLKRDAALQGAILRNGARLLRVGGRLVYSTCSLADEENDGVVGKLLAHKRHGGGLVLADALGDALADPSIAPLLDGVQRTKCGALMLPDRSRFGPLYWAVLERRSPAADGVDGGAASGDDSSSDAEEEDSRGDSGSGSDGDASTDEASGAEADGIAAIDVR